MKLKTEIIADIKHVGGANCVGWINSEDILSCGDDHLLMRTSVLSRDVSILCKLPTDVTPLDMHWPTRSPGGSGVSSAGSSGGGGGPSGSTTSNSGADIILITAADGRFHLISRTGRLERSVDAHQGACLVGRWSHDGAGFMTAGEDGLLKIWSRSGMLRSTLISCDTPIYSGAWAPDNQAVCHSNGRILCVRSLAANTKPIRWKAHESLVLKIAWCHTNGLIVSGGEDCRYRVWDAVGHPLYVSGYHDYPITAVAWSPSGDMFTVGGYNTLRVCDSTGWSQSLEKPSSGSLYQINWSSDGTQIAASCANGHLLYAHVIGKCYDWKHFTAHLQDKRTILITDNVNETHDQLDFPDRVIQVTLGFNYLVVATPTQCHVFSTTNWNTPVIFDLKEGAVCMLLSSEKYITIVERSNITVYNYQGRLVASPRWPGMYPESLSRATISLCGDMLVTRDTLDQRVIHLFDLSGGSTGSAQGGPGGGVRTNTDTGTHVQHTTVVIELALSHAGVAGDRHLAVIDVNRDLYLIPVREFGPKQFLKIGSQIQSLQWNIDADILAVIQDGRLVVWYSPVASAYNPRMLKLSSMEQDAELGRNPRIHSFQDTTVYVRRSDGSLVTVLISPYIFALHRDVMENKWERSLKLCRTIQDEVLWATMATLAVHAKMLEIAEEAFAAIQQPDKVTYIQYIKELPNRAQQIAGAALLKGSIAQAESILLHNGLLFHAINNNLNLYSWNRALDLALKHKSHIDTVLYVRKQYLNSLNKTELNPKFLQLNSTIEINEEAIKQKIDMEMKKNI